MTGLIKKAVLGTAMAASALAASAPADAQYYRGRGHRGGDTAAAAILGGIVGLGVGAAITSSNNRGRYYDRGYSYDRGYYDDGYYQRPRGYYYNDYNYNYRPRCFIERQYDQWNGRPYDVRVCR